MLDVTFLETYETSALWPISYTQECHACQWQLQIQDSGLREFELSVGKHMK